MNNNEDSIGDEDEETLAAIGEGIRDPDADRTDPIQEVRERLQSVT